VGEVPLLQQSKVFQLVAPFQLEVTNLLWVMEDFVRAKDFGGLATLVVANYLMNRVAEEVRGNGVTFDPIDAMLDAIEEIVNEENKGRGAMKAAGRLAGEVFSNVPLGQTIAAAYPEYGADFGFVKTPGRRELFGRDDPTRFGGGLVALKGIADPLQNLVLPFGGRQVKNTIKGILAANKGGVRDEKGKFKFRVNGMDVPKVILFGPNAGKGAKEYFRKRLEGKKKRKRLWER
jgi:hypothetical protein